MIIVVYKGLQATWNGEEWKSDDADFQDVLTAWIPEETFNTGSYFKIGQDETQGVDAVVYDSLKEQLGDELKIVENNPPLIPEDKEGVDYG